MTRLAPPLPASPLKMRWCGRPVRMAARAQTIEPAGNHMTLATDTETIPPAIKVRGTAETGTLS